MGAGHLKIGDTIKQADGTTGLVANVTTVGQDGWLVHNDVGQACGTLVPKIVDDLQSYTDRLNKKLSQYEKLGGFETAKADFATLLENYGVDPSRPSAEVNGDVMVVRVNTQGDVLIVRNRSGGAVGNVPALGNQVEGKIILKIRYK